MMEEEPVKMIEADVEMPNEDKENTNITEEEMNKYCGLREPEPEGRPAEDKGEARRYREQHRSQQGDDR
eukprot:12720237-Heterocapsa_arctica.AAC.1